MGGRCLYVVKNLGAIVHIEVTNRTNHVNTVWNNIVADTATYFTEWDNGGLFSDVNLTTDNMIDPSHDLWRGSNRINTIPRRWTMSLFAFYGNIKRVATGHDRAASITNLSSV